MLQEMQGMVIEFETMETKNNKWLIRIQQLLSNELIESAQQQRLLEIQENYLYEAEKYKNLKENLEEKMKLCKVLIGQLSREKVKLYFRYILNLLIFLRC